MMDASNSEVQKYCASHTDRMAAAAMGTVDAMTNRHGNAYGPVAI